MKKGLGKGLEMILLLAGFLLPSFGGNVKAEETRKKGEIENTRYMEELLNYAKIKYLKNPKIENNLFL